jgi:LacI family transcriptional regulator
VTVDYEGARPSIRDVARSAGVSTATVSNALNHPDRVATATLARITREIERLRFVPNARARSLVSGRTATVGLLVTDLANSYFVDIARGAQQAAHAAGYSPLIGSADSDSAKESAVLASFSAEQFAGVLLAPFVATVPVARLRRSDRPPTVLVNVEAPTSLACSAASDDVHGGFLAARHLIDLGHKRLLFVTSEPRLTPVDERRRGVERAVAEAHGVRLDVWAVGSLTVSEGARIATRLSTLRQSERPTGVVAPSDLLAMGLVNACRDTIAVPGELSVVGYDNDAAVRDARVPLTTIAQDGVTIGREAMGMLASEIDARERRAAHEHRSLRVAPHIVIRRSTSSAPFELDDVAPSGSC